MYHSVEADK